MGTIHQSVDWILITDVDKKYNLPLHIDYTELQPDITMYSDSAKKVILIEFTCLCEQNMEKQYDHNINKYLPLKSGIKSRGLEVDLYAIEVGAIIPSSSPSIPKSMLQEKKQFRKYGCFTMNCAIC